MDHLKLATQSVVKQWELITLQATRLLNKLTDEKLNSQVAPGKNTGKYIIGHLIAINDAIPQNLGIGVAEHPELMDVYVSKPDGTADQIISMDELRALWKETHERISILITNLPEMDWLERNNAVTDEEFQANPLRNRLSLLINRTNHFSYHAGQLRLLIS